MLQKGLRCRDWHVIGQQGTSAGPLYGGARMTTPEQDGSARIQVLDFGLITQPTGCGRLSMKSLKVAYIKYPRQDLRVVDGSQYTEKKGHSIFFYNCSMDFIEIISSLLQTVATGADQVKLQLPGAPEGGRQDGTAQGRDHRDLDRAGSVAQICGTTLETAGVTGAQDAASQRLATQVWVQAAARVQGERPRGVELWEGREAEKDDDECENQREG